MVDVLDNCYDREIAIMLNARGIIQGKLITRDPSSQKFRNYLDKLDILNNELEKKGIPQSQDTSGYGIYGD